MLKKSYFISALLIAFVLTSCNNGDSKDAKKDSVVAPVVKTDTPAMKAPAVIDTIMDSAAKRTGKPVHNP